MTYLPRVPELGNLTVLKNTGLADDKNSDTEDF
jgi:hypothetical protein